MAASYLRVFRQHFHSLSRIIGSHPDTCFMTAAELYSRDLISPEVKDDVTEKARAANVEVAMMLLRCLEVKIEESPALWETALEALDKMDGLKRLTKKMRGETEISYREFSSPQLHVAEIVDEVSRRDELLTLIKNLRTNFDSFLLGVKHELHDVEIDDIKLILTSALSNFSLLFDGKLDEYVSDINQQESLHTLLQYLISKNFCGFLNYELLANIVNALGNEKSKHLLHTYVECYKTFAKQVKLRELIQPYLEKNQLVQANIIGLPTITFEVDGSWLNRTLYTFRCAIASAFVSAWRMIYANADPGSIIITYTVLPEDLSYIIRDLTSNGEFLSKLGIKALLRNGSGKIISSLVDDDDTRGAKAQQCLVFCDAETQTVKVSKPSESISETVQSLDKKIAIALQMNMT
uniref:Uncharacterized protein n=1 Tax=Amphimedon queenslandica TaxID=400682 RepID=A0A1X7T6I2_AMPQE